MGRLAIVSTGSLASGLVLAPERYDPRRRVKVEARARLQDLFEIATDNTGAGNVGADSVLVLDTTHAQEGFVLHRHAPGPPDALGSTKRRLRPGDVIISRLRPYLRQVAYVDDALFRLVEGGNAVVASSEFYVLRARGPVPAAALVPYLLSEPVQSALAAAQEGGHHPRFGREVLERLSLPAWVLDDAEESARRVRELAGTVRSAMLERDRLVEEAGRRTLAGEHV